jgi:hypothetical protein
MASERGASQSWLYPASTRKQRPGQLRLEYGVQLGRGGVLPEITVGRPR